VPSTIIRADATAAGPSVLLVAGAYYPEISAAGLQCQAVAAALRGRARCSVLATAVNPALPASAVVDDVPVSRVFVDVRNGASKASASARLVWRLARSTMDVIHVHGVSQKNVPVALMARLRRKPVVLTLHTAGQDEPQVARRRGSLAAWAFTSPQLTLAVSPNLIRRCREDGLPADSIRLVPNGVDTGRFRPADAAERAALRRELHWPEREPVVVFVGFFSRDKRPDLLFRAWRCAVTAGVPATLVYIGATASPYYEIDTSLAASIRDGAAQLGQADRVLFVDPTHAMDKYYRAADLFVLSSVREANPVALLEAMACGLPCIASRLDGSTDVIVEDGANGRLVPPDDEQALAAALAAVLGDPEGARRMGILARETVVSRYDIRDTAERWLDAYRTVLGGIP
jgi:glycosyltransferase involved in cell wall biosynthesis